MRTKLEYTVVDGEKWSSALEKARRITADREKVDRDLGRSTVRDAGIYEYLELALMALTGYAEADGIAMIQYLCASFWEELDNPQIVEVNAIIANRMTKVMADDYPMIDEE